jgi:hypothetical protein
VVLLDGQFPAGSWLGAESTRGRGVPALALSIQSPQRLHTIYIADWIEPLPWPSRTTPRSAAACDQPGQIWRGSDHDRKAPGSPAQAPSREQAVVMSRKQAREPHPDPAIELQLQEILDLRDSIDRREALIEQYRKTIADLHQDARFDKNTERTKFFYERADQLDEKIRALEGEIEPVHERIRGLQGKISPDDLAFLGS